MARIQIELFGSLGATGKGYSTDKAVILGLMGESPESVNTGVISDCLERLEHSRRLVLCGMREIYFDSQVDLVFHRRKALPYHPNGMCCRALDADARILDERVYYPVGSGFVVDETAAGNERIVEDTAEVACPFRRVIQE